MQEWADSRPLLQGHDGSQLLFSNGHFVDGARCTQNGAGATESERGLSTLRSTAEDWQSAHRRSGINSALRKPPRCALKFSCEVIMRQPWVIRDEGRLRETAGSEKEHAGLDGHTVSRQDPLLAHTSGKFSLVDSFDYWLSR